MIGGVVVLRLRTRMGRRRIAMQLTRTGFLKGTFPIWVTITAAAVLASVTLVTTGPALAQEASAQPVPPGREWPSFAYDAARHELVLFGGDNLGSTDASGGFRGTWTRIGTRWTKRDPAHSPSGRTGAAMAYDAATRQLLLFGGSSPGGGVDAQTWLWTGNDWRRLYTPVAPHARADANLLYDAARRELIMFGGYQGRNSFPYSDQTYFHDTWAWTGHGWRRMYPKTVPAGEVAGASMVYDTATRTVILFGVYSPATHATEMWAWNGVTWRMLRSRSPFAANFARQAAYDPASRQLLAFGGNQYPPPDWLWVWAAGRWHRLRPSSSPRGRQSGSMIYDSATRQVVLFGGGGSRPGLYPDSTWTWNNGNWHLG
jgi:hypothetical protein